MGANRSRPETVRQSRCAPPFRRWQMVKSSDNGCRDAGRKPRPHKTLVVDTILLTKTKCEGGGN